MHALPQMLINPIALKGSDDNRFDPFGICFALDASSGRINVPLQFEGERADGVSALTAIIASNVHAIDSISRIERHLFSVQVFIPLDFRSTLTIVGPRGEPPRSIEQFSAFIIPPGHGIVYRAGTWHSGFMGFDSDTKILTFVRRIEDGSDTELFNLPFGLQVGEQVCPN